MAGGEYLRLHECCSQRGLRVGLAVGPKLVGGARALKRLTIRNAEDALLVSIEIGRSLDRASKEALNALRTQRF